MEMTRKEFHKSNTRVLTYGFIAGVVFGFLIGVSAN